MFIEPDLLRIARVHLLYDVDGDPGPDLVCRLVLARSQIGAFVRLYPFAYCPFDCFLCVHPVVGLEPWNTGLGLGLSDE